MLATCIGSGPWMNDEGVVVVALYRIVPLVIEIRLKYR